MLIRWDEIGSRRLGAADGATVTLSGYPGAMPGQNQATRFLLTQEAGCCPGCVPSDPNASVEIEARSAIAPSNPRMSAIIAAEGADFR